MWTKEQLEAIQCKNSNLLVAAAAGSGKTAVLVNRIIRIITDKENKCDIDSLLVVTFTNAAAAEMRERIASALTKEIKENNNSKYMQKQLMLLGKSYIMTLHSFCLQVIRNNFHKIDIDPEFRIAEEAEVILLKQKAVDDLFESKYETDTNTLNSDFSGLIDAYGSNRDDKYVKDLVLNLYNFSQSTQDPEKFLSDAADALDVKDDFELNNTKYIDEIRNIIRIETEGMRDILQSAREISMEDDKLLPYEKTIESDIQNIESIHKSTDSDFNSLREAFNSITFATLGRCKKGADDTLKENVKKLRNEYKARIQKIKEELFSLDEDSIKEQFKKMYPLMKALSNLTIEFSKLYNEEKKRRSIIDFNDIEHLCIKLLYDKKDGKSILSETALGLRKKFNEVLVDEYQDSNLVQERILKAVSRSDDSPNLFMVGDIKQSIYRFRLARPELFLEKYNSYSELEGSRNRKILLYKNFRSRQEVLNSVNFIFTKIMSKSVGEMDYTQKEKLNLGADYPENLMDYKTEVDIVDSQKTETEDDESIDSIELEAMYTAFRIKKLMSDNSMVYDSHLNRYRKIRYSDIVILMRTTRNWADTFKDVFRKYSIPVFTDTGTGYFETTEVKIMLSLLKIIDNPLQDIPYIAVLRSQIAGFSSDELAQIRSFSDKLHFYEIFECIALDKRENLKDMDLNEELELKIKDFYNRLNRWRDRALISPIYELIWYLFKDTGYYGYVGTMPQGAQRQANLKILFQRARQFEESSLKGLFNFINFTEKLKSSSGDMGSAKVLSENENVVRIMSIHKSKGLEFPVVILAGTGKKFNMQDAAKNILFNLDLGYGPNIVDIEKRITYPSLAKIVIKNKIKLETLSEEMRILYVAMTRAKEKLIIIGSRENADESIDKLNDTSSGENVSKAHVLHSACCLDWICYALSKTGFLSKLKDKEYIDDNWEVNIIKRDVIYSLINDEENEIKISEVQNQSKYYDEIKRRLEFVYPYEDLNKVTQKISVTELKRHLNDESEDSLNIYADNTLKTPLFMQERKVMSAADKGTAIHEAMQHINFKGDLSLEGIKLQLEDMKDRFIITKEEFLSIDPDKIYRFMDSELGKRIRKSKNVKREFRFQVKLKMNEVYKEFKESKFDSENLILQGAVDCFFEEENGIILLDYKTDFVKDGFEDEIVKRYSPQLKYYSMAISKITGKKVVEKYLYLFSLNKYIKI